MRLAISCLCLVVVVLVVPSAASQSTVTVTLNGLPTQPTMTKDSTYRQFFSVGAQVTQVVCPQEGTLPVAVTATSPSLSASEFTFEPGAQLSIRIPANQYLVQPFSGDADAFLILKPNAIPPGGLNATIEVKAASGPMTGGCQGGSATPDDDTKSFTVGFDAGPVPASPTPKMPSPSAALVFAALAVLVVARRHF